MVFIQKQLCLLSLHTTFPLAQCLQHIQYVFTSKKTAICTPLSSTGAAVREEFMGPMLGPEACGEGPQCHLTAHLMTEQSRRHPCTYIQYIFHHRPHSVCEVCREAH